LITERTEVKKSALSEEVKGRFVTNPLGEGGGERGGGRERGRKGREGGEGGEGAGRGGRGARARACVRARAV
jgi:hypothetical protein